jgi:uncharacterized protein (TIGR03435 family)
MRIGFSFQPGGRMLLVNAPVMMLLLQAYLIPDSRIVGAPPWTRSERYDVTAQAEGDPPREQMRQMARALLADRFKMAAHIETREQEGFALVLARSDASLGPQIRRSAVDCAAREAAERAGTPQPPAPPAANGGPVCGTNAGNGALTSGAIKMPLLALSLSLAVDRPVVDMTGLPGDYEVTLKYSPERRLGAGPDADRPAGDDASIFTAVQEQLGLKLVPHHGTAEFLVIDHLERPTAN